MAQNLCSYQVSNVDELIKDICCLTRYVIATVNWRILSSKQEKGANIYWLDSQKILGNWSGEELFPISFWKTRNIYSLWHCRLYKLHSDSYWASCFAFCPSENEFLWSIEWFLVTVEAHANDVCMLLEGVLN